VLGVGLGLLLASSLNDDQRKAAGRSLFLVGAFRTIPVAIDVLGKLEAHSAPEAGGTRAISSPTSD
jgi:hypothetical protein